MDTRTMCADGHTHCVWFLSAVASMGQTKLLTQLNSTTFKSIFMLFLKGIFPNDLMFLGHQDPRNWPTKS